MPNDGEAGGDRPQLRAMRPRRNRVRYRSTIRIAGLVALLLGVIGLVCRIELVRIGALYGTSAVTQVDWLAGGLTSIGVALLVLAWSLGRDRAEAEQRRPTERLTELLSVSTALGGVVAVVVASLNLFVPAVPASLSTPVCPGVPVRQVKYIGLMAGEEGVNSRSGPSRAHLPNGRFPKGCSVGFSHYCIGEPIRDNTGSTEEVTWFTSRWLVVSRQRSPFLGKAAEIVSGEVREDRYISDAFVTPQTRYDQLPDGGSLCRDHDRYPQPEKAVLQPLASTDGDLATGALSAHSRHA